MDEKNKSMSKFIHNTWKILKSVSQFLKQHYSKILLIAFVFFISTYSSNTNYFKSDVNVFERSVEQYNTSFTLIFLFVAVVIFVVYLFSERYKQKPTKAKEDFFIKSFFFTFIMSMLIISSFHKSITHIALFVNKLKVENTIVRDYLIGRYNVEQNELVILDNAFEAVKMDYKTYSSINNDSIISLKFDVGLFKIPFNPRFVPKQ